MKKTSILALALMAVFALASCNRQEIDPPQEGVQGKYLLTEITAYTGDDDTKAYPESNGVVFWAAHDHIAVKGTDGALHLYEIKSGVDTPIGKFLPANGHTPASYNSLSDLTAISPACAAELSGGELYVNINNQDLSGNFQDKGLSFWNSDSPVTFTNNDIKVAVPSKSSRDTGGKVNFKFKQLGTCCNFLIDFRQAEQAASLITESVERYQYTTLEGVALGGRAKVNGTSLGEITNPVTTINWIRSTPSDMSKLLNGMLVFYPEVTTNTTLKITLTTTNHEFVFTGKPTQDFESGKKLTFPITVDKNFTRGEGQLSYTSTVLTPADQFYYYGGTNCLLIPTTNTLGFLDVTQYVTDKRWHNTKNTTDIITHKPAAYARIIWSEGPDVIANDMVDATNDYKLKLTGSAAGSADAISTDINGKSTLTIKRGSAAGNALVGIYDSGDNLLWSYHIWCPEDNPIVDMNEFLNLSSGDYRVMTMPIGAIYKAAPGMSNPEKAAGFYYQWGRKDPMGRPANYNNEVGEDVLLEVKGADQSTPFSEGNLFDCKVWFAHDDNTEAHNTLYNAWNESGQSKSLDYFILDYSVSNPWNFICCSKSTYFNSWIPTDYWLWGNGYGHVAFPVMEDTYKSIFDPSPEGFRVAPEDILEPFTSSRRGKNTTASGDELTAYILENFNVPSATYKRDNHANGFEFYYEGWKTGPTRFVLTNGTRVKDGSVLGLISETLIWTSSRGDNNRPARAQIGNKCIYPLSYADPCRAYNVWCVEEY